MQPVHHVGIYTAIMQRFVRLVVPISRTLRISSSATFCSRLRFASTLSGRSPPKMTPKSQQRPGWKANYEKPLLNVHFTPLAVTSDTGLVVFAMEGGKLCPTAATIDSKYDGAITRAIARSRFTGKVGQTTHLVLSAGGVPERITVAGIGKPEVFDSLAAKNVGAAIVSELQNSGLQSISVAADLIPNCSMTVKDIACSVAYGARLRSYRFDAYRTTQKDDEKPSLTSLVVMSSNAEAIADAKHEFAAMCLPVAESVELARDLVSEPSNELNPIGVHDFTV